MGTQNGGIQSSDRFKEMIEIMRENGSMMQQNAMANSGGDAMNKFMTNISDEDICFEVSVN